MRDYILDKSGRMICEIDVELIGNNQCCPIHLNPCRYRVRHRSHLNLIPDYDSDYDGDGENQPFFSI